MNLVWHQFRKDVRQFRIMLAIWFGLLLLELAVNVGWVGQVAYSSKNGFAWASNTWTRLLPAVIWIAIAVLPSLVVLTDSPARREGFLATRPLPKLDLFLAKMLFILALIVAPWVLQELIHLLWRGAPAWVVWRGTFERLLFTLPVAIGFGAYAALWPGYGRWARAVAITVVGAYGSLLIVALVAEFILHHGDPSPDLNMTQFMAGVYVAVLALFAVTAWHARAHRGAPARWGALALVAMSFGLTMLVWPWDYLALRPENPGTANALVANAHMEIPPRTFNLAKVQIADKAGHPYFSITLTPRTEPLPTNLLVDWRTTAAKITRAAGGEIRGPRIKRGNVFNGANWNNSYNAPDFAAWSAEFPPDVLFRQDVYYGSATSEGLSFNGFPLPAKREELTAPLAFHAGFEARVFQWRKIADLPLTPGATATDEFGAWKLVAAHPATTAQFVLERRQIALATAANSRCSSAEDGPLDRMAFLIYDPQHHVAWLPDQTIRDAATRGTDTALSYHYVQLSLNNPQRSARQASAQDRAIFAQDRLIILEESWLGSVPEQWESPAFTLDEQLPPAAAALADNQDPMPRTEFNRRVAALTVPAPDASRREVAAYLLQYLRLVDAQRFTLSLDDPCTRQLANLVPAHLDLLLDGLPEMDWTAKATAFNALKLGATDAQKPLIIAALPREPELALVLFARGWVDDARTEILQLAESPRPLPLDAIRAIAWFHEPQTFPRLLEEFEADPSVAADAMLGTLPGMEPQLDAIVARAWRENLVSRRNGLVLRQNDWEMFGEGFRLALRHGQTNALQRAYVVLNDPQLDLSSFDYQLAASLRDTVQMPDVPPEDRQQTAVVLAWMRKHRPADFVFNPALRQFVLRSNLSMDPQNIQHPTSNIQHPMQEGKTRPAFGDLAFSAQMYRGRIVQGNLSAGQTASNP